MFWGVFWLCVVGIIVALAVVFSLRFGAPNDNSSSNEYAPNETRSVHYSTTLCQSVTAEYDPSVSDYNSSATFYILSETPPLNDHDELTFSRKELFSAYSAYNYWSYYLYPGSNFHASVCKDDIVSMKFYLIRGNKNFNKWIDDPSSSYALYTKSINNVCPDRYNYTYNVKTEGEYYLVYRLESYSRTYLSVNFDFHRTKFTLDPSKIISNCTLDVGSFSSKCSLDVPMSSNVGLVSVNPFTELDGQASLSFSCGARIWFYSVVSVVTVAVIVLIIASIIIVICCVFRHRKKKYAPLAGGNQPSPSTTGPAPSTATYVSGTQPPPPPYNPSYGGTASDQPPKYY